MWAVVLSVLLVLLVLSAGVAIWLWITYNGLVRLRNEVETAWSQVGTETQRRLDLIPPLVNTVKGYAAHEKTTFEAVIQARNSALTQGPSATVDASSDFLSQALGKLFALQEAYPNLKADESFLNLQRQLTDIERQLNLSRRFFNESVRVFNTKQQEFPANLVASRLGFTSTTQFQALSEAADPPVVDFTR